MVTTRERYMAELKGRAKDSHVYRKYQMIGLEVAEILNDEKHKALYIKLAKERGADLILRIAKEVADKKNINNKGAYFMAALKGFNQDKHEKPDSHD